MQAINWLIAFFMLFFLCSFPVGAEVSDDNKDEASSWKPVGFLQQEFEEIHGSDAHPRFLIRRARLGVSGKLRDNISISFVGGALEGPDNVPALVNGFIDVAFDPLFQVRAGQFLLPFGKEGSEAIFRNASIERSEAVRALNPYALLRDVGVMIMGNGAYAGYSIALVNGAGANQFDHLQISDVVARGYTTPFEGFELGVSGNYGEKQNFFHEYRYSLLRAGADITYQSGPGLAAGEFIFRRDENANLTYEAFGGYLLGGYKVTEKLQFIIRGEYLEGSSLTQGTSPIRTYDKQAVMPGVNYYFSDLSRVAVNYHFRNRAENVLSMQLQVVL